jgi:dienelactone hydrolase
MYQKNPGGFVNPLNGKLSFFTFLSFFVVTFISTAYAQTMQTSQVSVYTRIESNVGGFLESLPNDYGANPTQKYPLLIAMHGVGERGNGTAGILEKVANVGIPKRIKNGGFPASFTVGGKSFSFIVISPQMANAGDWTASIQAVIDYCKAHYRVDETRIYLTGLSLGGISEWIYIGRSPLHARGLAAALLVTPGTTYTDAQLKNIANEQLPVWVTNNSGDPYNPASGATALVNAINSTVGVPKALITIFDKTGHDAWTQTYDPAFKQDGLNVYEWMLSKSRGSQSSPVTPVLTANAGPDQILTLPDNAVTLDASGSKVTSGTITSYSWTKVSGPTTGLLSLLSAGLQGKLTDLIAGTYVYRLTVKDSNGSTTSDDVTVTVNAAATFTNPPAVNAGSGQTVTLPTNTATIDGSSSTASAGNAIVSYQWTKNATSPEGGDITSGTSAKTTVANLIAGTYTYTLTVTDNRGSVKSGTTTVVVNSTATSTDPPATNAGKGQTITLPTNTVTLNGSLSKASAGNTIVSYKWVKAASSPAGGDITSPTSVGTTVTNLIAGTYIFNLTVTDSRGSSRTGGTSVVVNTGTVASTDPPTAKVAESMINMTLPSNAVTLDGSSSSASSGNTIVAYKWTKYTGPKYDGLKTPANPTLTVTGMVAGSYGFTLTVTDNNGKTSSKNVAVIVKAAASARTASVETVATGDVALSNSKTLDIKAFEVSIAPNPVQSNMNIRVNGSTAGKTSILIYNVAGQLQLQQEFTKDAGSLNQQVNISKLPAGMYIVQVVIDEKHKQILRIVKQ